MAEQILQRLLLRPDEGLNRRFFEFRTQFLGPVFTRIWNTPDNGYAEKFKHTIEPYLSIDRTSSIDNQSQIVILEGIDSIYGNTTRYDYGLNNRFYAKRRSPANSPLRVSQAREILDVTVAQSYYTQPGAAQYDPQYATSFNNTAPNNFSPIALSVRALPTDEINATVRAEWDSRYRALRTISASGGYTIQNTLAPPQPSPSPEAERALWYQWYFNTERGRAGLAANRRALCRFLWQTWSPTWRFTDETYDRTAAAFDNPDFVDVVIHSYRHRNGNAPGEPRFADMEKALAKRPPIAVPAIVLYGADDGIARPPAELSRSARRCSRPCAT